MVDGGIEISFDIFFFSTFRVYRKMMRRRTERPKTHTFPYESRRVNDKRQGHDIRMKYER